MGNSANNGFDPKAFLAKVGAGKTILKFEKNQHVFRQGDAADAVFYIQKGSVKLTVLSKQGKEAVVGILEPGQFFGEGCLNVQSSQLLIDGRHVDPYQELAQCPLSAYKVLSSISGLIGRRLGASMEGSGKQNGECPYCCDPFEIAQVKFGFNCISSVFACPNCRLASISRTTEHDKLWLLLSNGLRPHLENAERENSRLLDRLPQVRVDFR